MRRRPETSSKAGKRGSKRSASRVTGPVVNASSIEVALLMWMSLSDSDREECQRRMSLLEAEIARQEASSALEALAKAGCNRDKLLQSLGLSRGQPVDPIYDNWFTKPGPMSIKALFGLNSRAFDALKESLLKAADSIDAIERHVEFGLLLTTPHLGVFQGLPRLIQGYVSLLNLAAERLGRGTHFYRNLGTAIFILYVKHQTGRSLHEQVSALLAAARNDDDYDVMKHHEWMKEHKQLLDRVADFIGFFSCKDPKLLLKVLEQPNSHLSSL
jgi:hypothetical protein